VRFCDAFELQGDTKKSEKGTLFGSDAWNVLAVSEMLTSLGTAFEPLKTAALVPTFQKKRYEP
jgi:hypothetical protein